MFGQYGAEKCSKQCAAENQRESTRTDFEGIHVTRGLYMIRNRQELSIDGMVM
jgi:hypothetical protein